MKRNFIKPRTIAIASLLLVAALSSCGGAKLEQEVSDDSCINDTKYVVTRVRIYNWIGWCKTLEYYEQESVKSDKVDSIKEVEYRKALPIFELAKGCH